MKSSHLYFIALIPPHYVRDTIQEIKNYISGKYHSKKALQSPPHITLVSPFYYSIQQEKFLIEKIQSFPMPQNITITINNYNTFQPAVVFIHVEKNDVLEKLHAQLNVYTQTILNITNKSKHSSFHPHITVAFKDIDQSTCTLILQDLQQNFPIKETFQVNKLSLLKHNGNFWEIIV